MSDDATDGQDAAVPAALSTPTLYRSLFAAYPDALLLVDAAGTIVMGNPAASRLLGYGVDELAGLPVDALVPDAIRPRHAAYRSAYARNPRARPMGTQMELVARRRDGAEVMVEIALSPLHDQGVPLVVAAVRGIEAYPRVQQALQRARYSEFVAQMGRLAVDTRDPQMLLREIPAVAVEALRADTAVIYLLEPNRLEFRIGSGVGLADGDGATEAVGQRLSNQPDTPPGYVLDRGTPVTTIDAASETRFRVPADWLAPAGVVSALAVPLSDRGQTVGVLAVRSHQGKRFDDDEVRFLQSLSNLLATSLQRAQTEEALNHSQRLESVGQLTGGIAHDFNNLLTVIQGNLQVLEEHPAVTEDEGARQMIAAAWRASRRGAELTAKLLAFSRRQVLSPTRVDVAALLESLADMLRRTLDQRIRIEVDVAAAAPCLADPGQLDAALLNLAINARDAMPDGGTLSFACRRSPELTPELASELGLSMQAAAASDGGEGHVAIEVADTGRGMSEAVRERAFEPFFTTKELGRGTGLGLATVYGLVKQSSGAVRLRSAPGEGTTVTLILPRFRDARTASPDDPEALPALRAGLRVLVVEDEAEVRAVVRRQLEALGCSVAEFASGEQALESLSDGTAAHDLLLTDVALGTGMRGTELAREVRRRLPGIALLLMSGYSSQLLRSEESEPGAPELLRKPFDRAQLEQALARALAVGEG
jgi:PAS domain S-box-containing protein